MPSDRRAILQLLAIGRIDAAHAERLLAIVSEERETAWVLAGCAAFAVLTQLHGLVPELVSVFKAALAGSLPALQHVFTTIALFLGGRL